MISLSNNYNTQQYKNYNADRNQFRFDIVRESDDNGYEKVRWMIDREIPWRTWRFTAYAIWINSDQIDTIVAFKLTFGGNTYR
ncbi:MAG: hypothetical protein WCO00_12740 [Rhodospirillaceae bacterium]